MAKPDPNWPPPELLLPDMETLERLSKPIPSHEWKRHISNEYFTGDVYYCCVAEKDWINYTQTGPVIVCPQCCEEFDSGRILG